MNKTNISIKTTKRLSKKGNFSTVQGLMGKLRPIRFVFILLFLTLLLGCSPIAIPTYEEPTTQPTAENNIDMTTAPTETGLPPTPLDNPKEATVTEEPVEATSYDPALEPLVTKAVQDLSQRLGIDVDQIKVTSAEMVVWPDASLGCPQPDMVYTQVPVDGTLILLSVAGKVYEYHGGGWTDPFLCEQVTKTKPDPTQIDLLKLTPPPGNTEDQ